MSPSLMDRRLFSRHPRWVALSMALELTICRLGKLDSPTVVQARTLIGPVIISRTLWYLCPVTLGTTSPKTPRPPRMRLSWALLGPRFVFVATMTTVVLMTLLQALVQTPTPFIKGTLRSTLTVLFLVPVRLVLTRMTLENSPSRTSVKVDVELMKL